MGAIGTTLRSALRPAKVDHTVDALDFAAFMGFWYQSAATPNYFQTIGARDVVTNYQAVSSVMPAMQFSVANCEVLSDEHVNCVVGQAHSDSSFAHDAGKFLVEFPRDFPQQQNQYWVFMLGPISPTSKLYDWAIVGDATLSYVWLLTRIPLERGSEHAVAIIRAFEAEHPSHSAQLRWTRHTGYWDKHALPVDQRPSDATNR